MTYVYFDNSGRAVGVGKSPLRQTCGKFRIAKSERLDKLPPADAADIRAIFLMRPADVAPPRRLLKNLDAEDAIIPPEEAAVVAIPRSHLWGPR